MKSHFKDEIVSKIIVVCLVIAVLVGETFSLPQLRFAGIVPTFYRATVLLAALYYIVRRFILRRATAPLSRFFLLATAVMVFWIAYALVQLFVIPGLDRREGAKEIMFLGLGLLSIYCFYEANTSTSVFPLIVKTIRILALGLILLALFEITFGLHLPTSRYCDPEFLQSKWYINHFSSQQIVWHTATGPFYNQNDLLFALAMLSPFFFHSPSASLREKIFCYTCLALTFLLLMINGSFIVSVAMLTGVLLYLLLTKASIKKHLIIWPSAFLIQAFISKWIYSLLQYIYWLFNKSAGSIQENSQSFDTAQSFNEELTTQVSNLGAQQGSMYRRLTIYEDSLGAFLHSKGLGVGPNGFFRYFSEHPSNSGLVNPHNWWLEVLVQFGAPVFIAYAAVMLTSFIKALRMYFKYRFWGLAVIAGMLVIFAIGCIAPSSLIGASYQWLPLALCVSMLRPDYFSKEDGSGVKK